MVCQDAGVDIANLLEHGIRAPIPIDVSARLVLGNIAPGSGLFKKSANDKGREVAEVFELRAPTS